MQRKALPPSTSVPLPVLLQQVNLKVEGIYHIMEPLAETGLAHGQSSLRRPARHAHRGGFRSSSSRAIDSEIQIPEHDSVIVDPYSMVPEAVDEPTSFRLSGRSAWAHTIG